MKLLDRPTAVRARLRPWPAPYRAAMAICNDIDCTTFPELLETHRFLNTTQPTPFGPGLGLRIGNSFWMYSVNPDHDKGFAYFRDLEGTPGPEAPRIRELIRAGVLDVLHTYGNFSQHGGFRRRHAEIAAAELAEWDLRPRVWVNHGDCHNFQNIHGAAGQDTFAGGRPFRQGADGVPVRNLEYHLDITRALGVRFLWVHELTQDIGQDRPLSAREHIFRLNALKRRRWWRRDLPALGKAWLSGGSDAAGRGMRANGLLEPYPLDAGAFYRFRRFGQYGPDCMPHLPVLLADDVLDTLTASGGAMVLFAHLGKRPQQAGPVFSAAAADALRGLGRRYRDGALYVETTSRLLRYIAVRDALRYDIVADAGGVVLDIREVDDPVLGRFTPSADDLAGICFEVASPQRPRVTVAGRDASPRFTDCGSSQYLVQFPIASLDPGDALD